MKIGNQTTSEFESNANITSENSTEFQIGDPTIVIEILRKRLYSNPIQTATQEYLCNGRDATREAGNEQTPLIVTLPGHDGNSELRIRDFGKGLPPEKMKNVFVYYGVSTKRGTDKYTGGFGIGAKSAWAYTDSFMVLTFVDGIAYHYAAFINEKSVGELTLMSQLETDQPNGTEIRIPVNPSDSHAFAQAVFRATMFWDVKPTVLGRNYPTLTMKPMFEDKNIAMYEPQELGRMFSPQDSYNLGVVLSIDGIPYPLERNFESISEVAQFKKYVKDGRVTVIKTNTGDIEVSASREKVADSDFSKKKIAALFQKELGKCISYVEEKTAECKSLQELVSVSAQINKLFKVNASYKFKASENNTYEVDSSGCLKSPLFDGAVIESWAYTSTSKRKNILKGEVARNIYLYGTHQFVLNDTNDGPNVLREKVRMLLAKGAKTIYLLRAKSVENTTQFTDKDIAQFINEMGGCTLSSIVRPKRAKVVRPDVAAEDLDPADLTASVYYFRRTHGLYSGSKPGYLDLLNLSDLPSDKKIVYVVREKQNVYTSPYSVKGFEDLTQYFDSRKVETKTEFCAVTLKALELVKDHPQFITLDDYLSNLDPKIVERIQQGLVKEIHRNSDSRLSKLDYIIEKLDDKKLKEKREFLRAFPYGLGHNEIFVSHVRNNYASVLEQEKLVDAAFCEYFTKSYPLLDRFYSSDLRDSEEMKNEIIIYMNLKYGKIMADGGN